VPPGADTAPTGPASSVTGAGGESSINLGPTFTPDQLRELADHLVETGAMSREEADKSLAMDGVMPEAEPGTDPNLSPQAEEIDSFFPPAKPEEYEMPPLVQGEGEYTKDAAAFDQKTRGWLASGRFPKEIGSAVARAANEAAALHLKPDGSPRMSPAEAEIWRRGEYAKLERMWGSETKAKIALARQLVAEVNERSPGLIDYLEITGAGNSSMVIAQIAMQAERLAARLKS
jgi:hypothetical protein